MAKDTPIELKPVSGAVKKNKKSKGPKRKYRSSTIVSKDVPDFAYQQAQSLRWLHTRKDGPEGKSISGSIMHGLIKYFKCQSLEEREARPELPAESKALIGMLENERARARTLQGGVANPNDWFITTGEERSLAALMDKVTVADDGTSKMKDKPQSKAARRRVRRQDEAQHRAKAVAEAGGEEIFEATKLLDGLQVVSAFSAGVKAQKGRGKGRRPENNRQRKLREFLEKKDREREEREAVEAAEVEKGEEWDDMATDK